MAQIIFAVEKPDLDQYENENKWVNCTSNLLNLTNKNKEIQLLGENVLLIELDNNLDALAKVIPAICGLLYSYQVLNESLTLRKVTRQV